MDACTSVSGIQLVVMAFTFLLAVVSLDVFWVRIPEELHHGDIAGAPGSGMHSSQPARSAPSSCFFSGSAPAPTAPSEPASI